MKFGPFENAIETTIAYGILDAIMATMVEIDKAGRIVVPKALRDSLRVRAGDRFLVGEKDDGIFLEPMYDEVRLVERDGLWVMVGGPPSEKSAVELIAEDRERRIRYVSGEVGRAVKVFLDTSVLIAAHDMADPRHAPSFSLLSAARPETTACGVHTLAETYSVLSRLPGGKKRRPEYASLLIDQILARITVYSLSPEEYAATIRAAAAKSLAGGIIFDGLLLACARKSQAQRIYTWNEKHFRMVAPDLAERIMTP